LTTPFSFQPVARQDGTTLRVAGGWVRDRLLRDQPVRATLERGLYVDHSEESDERGSKDIDLALDDQLGSEFAAKVSAWLEEHGEGAAAGVATILKNPEKSKHLETATMNLRGFSIGPCVKHHPRSPIFDIIFHHLLLLLFLEQTL
jgi:tRNA nucleotidyltransferase/poly(A) polymerase